MSLLQRLKTFSHAARTELAVYRRVIADPRTPLAARLLLGLAVAYLVSPIDLIPDFIPVLGQLDDLVIVPLLVFLALRCVPPQLLAEHREKSIAKPDKVG